jgi:hypothetical protein
MPAFLQWNKIYVHEDYIKKKFRMSQTMKFSATALKNLSKESILLSLTRDDDIPEAIARGIVDDLISDDSDSPDRDDSDSEDSDNSDSDSNDDSSLGADLPPLVKK